MVQSAALLFEGETSGMLDINRRVAQVCNCSLSTVYYDYFYSVLFPPCIMQYSPTFSKAYILSRYKLSNLDQQLILQS